MGYGGLIRVLGEEAAREAREVRRRAVEERDRILAEARTASTAALEALLARERIEAEARRREALASVALERERTLLVERRRLLDALRSEAEEALTAAADDDALARLVGEVVTAAPPGHFTLVVDPGDVERVRSSLQAAYPEALARAELAEAPARRGGVELRAGRLVLDDTLPARLARAWPRLEPALVRQLFGEGT
jgi:V/A-type H+/Na+-transporting ATPase subunit E